MLVDILSVVYNARTPMRQLQGEKWVIRDFIYIVTMMMTYSNTHVLRAVVLCLFLIDNASEKFESE